MWMFPNGTWTWYIDRHIEPEDDFLEYHKKQLAIAIDRNDVIGLKYLLDTYGGIGLVDCAKKTLLIFAIGYCNNYEVFDVLLNTEGVDIDATYFKLRYNDDPIEETALNLSLDLLGRERLAIALIKKGANIHIGPTLCLAVHRKYLEICLHLIEKGVDIERCDSEGITPFNRACADNWVEGIYMLLYYGADVNSIGHGLTYRTYRDIDPELKEILFHHIYDEIECPRTSSELITIVKFHRSFLGRFLECTSEIIRIYIFSYDRCRDLDDLLRLFEPKYFQILATKFESFVKSVILGSSDFNCLRNRLEVDVKRATANITILLNSNLSHHFIGRINADQGSKFSIGNLFKYCVSSFILDNINLREVINAISLLLSNGLNVTMHDVNIVYQKFGFSPLFKQMIHMDIHSEKEERQNHVMPVLICRVGTTLESILQDMKKERTELHESARLYKLSSIAAALDYFCDDQLKEFCLTLDDKKIQQKLEELPRVPLLLELARNAARKHIVQSYGVETFRQFSEILNRFRLVPDYKEILTYEMKLYK